MIRPDLVLRRTTPRYIPRNHGYKSFLSPLSILRAWLSHANPFLSNGTITSCALAIVFPKVSSIWSLSCPRWISRKIEGVFLFVWSILASRGTKQSTLTWSGNKSLIWRLYSTIPSYYRFLCLWVLLFPSESRIFGRCEFPRAIKYRILYAMRNTRSARYKSNIPIILFATNTVHTSVQLC